MFAGNQASKQERNPKAWEIRELVLRPGAHVKFVMIIIASAGRNFGLKAWLCGVDIFNVDLRIRLETLPMQGL